MPTYNATLILTDIAGNGTKTLTGELSDDEPPPPNPEGAQLHFSADFSALPADHAMDTQADWDTVFAEAISKGVEVFCLEQSTGVTARNFTIIKGGRNGGNCLRAKMAKGSYGMGYRSVTMGLGPAGGAVNIEFDFMVEDVGVNLFTEGGGKWGAAIQYGSITSGSNGGLRWMPIWPAGASTLGRQDLTIGLQDQRDGKQWVQPVYNGHRPIMTNHWYKIRTRMTGGVIDAPGAVLCEYWKDDDPVFSYEAATDNPNVLQGKAGVTIDLCCFFGGGEANAAPADAYFRYGEAFRVWVE